VHAQSDLFERPRLFGLVQAEDIVEADEEQALIASIDAVELSPFRFHGWFGKRLTASFGWNYDFDTARFAPTEPIPAWLLPLRARAAQFAGLEADELGQALLIRYDVGAGIGWHRDRLVFEHVVGISLGAPTTMRFRRRQGSGFQRAAVGLRRGASRVGAQHCRNGGDALVDHLPEPGCKSHSPTFSALPLVRRTVVAVC